MKTILMLVGICIVCALVGSITSTVLLFCFKAYPAMTGFIHFLSGFYSGILWTTLYTTYCQE